MVNPYDITVDDPRELSSDIQSEIMSMADADYICEIHIEHIRSWLKERSEEWLEEKGVPL
mgnify:FL=1|jgi:hypothetical protein